MAVRALFLKSAIWSFFHVGEYIVSFCQRHKHSWFSHLNFPWKMPKALQKMIVSSSFRFCFFFYLTDKECLWLIIWQNRTPGFPMEWLIVVCSGSFLTFGLANLPCDVKYQGPGMRLLRKLQARVMDCLGGC